METHMLLITLVGLLPDTIVCLQKYHNLQLNKQHCLPYTIGSRWESTTRFIH